MEQARATMDPRMAVNGLIINCNELNCDDKVVVNIIKDGNCSFIM